MENACTTMRCLAVALKLSSKVQAQRPWWDRFQQYFNQNKYDYTIDYVHNYRFEDHDNQKGYHLIVAISDTVGLRECHLVEVDDTWEQLLEDDDKVHAITEEIYHLIDHHTGQETQLTRDELRQKYGDQDALRECFNHTVFLLSYTPSSSITG